MNNPLLVSQVRNEATKWALENAKNYPEYAGVFFMGSILWYGGGEVWDDASDVDIRILVRNYTDAHQHAGIDHKGFIIDLSFASIDELGPPDKILSDPFGAHNYFHNCIIDDPLGLLSTLHEHVRKNFHRKKFVLDRLENLYRNSHAKLTRTRDGERNGFDVILGYSLGIRNLAALFAIYRLLNPSFRLCFPMARTALEKLGMGDEYPRMLGLIADRKPPANRVARMIENSRPFYENAVDIMTTPFWGNFYLVEGHGRHYFASIESLLRDLNIIEALFVLVYKNYFIYKAIELDGADELKKKNLAHMTELLALADVNCLDDYKSRSTEALKLLDSTRCLLMARINEG
ncbi:hypothetical protein ACFL1X_12850 [Candidatus Hydrogenedentota bacterium]